MCFYLPLRPTPEGDGLPLPTAVKLFADLVMKGYQTLVFTRARQGTEQYARWAQNIIRDRGQSDLADDIHPYHGNLEAADRREIEQKLTDGEARGVWATNALEVGVDIGTLDVVILDGYPGTLMETFQRAGRAGRGDQECLVVIVGSDNPLDQYILSHPDELFDDDAEDATLNPANHAIQPDHLVCAAADHYLSTDDSEYFEGDYPGRVSSLQNQGRLERTDEVDIRWDAATDRPYDETDIRAIDNVGITVVDRLEDEKLGSLSLNDALRDVHPEAIYMYRGQSYQVLELNIANRRALVEKVDTTAYTRALRQKEVTIQDTLETGTVDFSAAGGGDDSDGSGTSLTVKKTLADLSVASRYDSYLYHTGQGDDDPEERPMPEELPPHEIDTRGLFIELPASVGSAVSSQRDEDDGYLAALHAVEHTLISLFPSAVLCDRGDIGGLSIERHPQTAGGTIFVHDAYDGGAGYSRAAYDQLGEMLTRTHETIQTCECRSGCPSCVYSPQCGNANRTISKRLAEVLLSRIT